MNESARTPDTADVVIQEAREVTGELVDALHEFRNRLGRRTVSYTPSASDLEAIIRNSSTQLLVARAEAGTIYGALTLVVYPLPSGIRSWIEDLVVLPPQSGRGLGVVLVEEAVRRARIAGAERIELLVDPSQVAARNVFQRMGFRPYDKSPYSLRLGAEGGR